MDVQYLVTEHTKYDGCREPLVLNDGERYYFQPPEVTENCLEEVIRECIAIRHKEMERMSAVISK